jgi:hypothetical protein
LFNAVCRKKCLITNVFKKNTEEEERRERRRKEKVYGSIL